MEFGNLIVLSTRTLHCVNMVEVNPRGDEVSTRKVLWEMTVYLRQQMAIQCYVK